MDYEKRQPTSFKFMLFADLDDSGLHAIAEYSLRLTGAIRDYLPIKGDTELEQDWRALEDGYSFAVRIYEVIERRRNPELLPWPGPRGSGCITLTPDAHIGGAGECYRKLGREVEPLVEHYGWQSVSDESGTPVAGAYAGKTVPPIDGKILNAIENTAQRLLELTAGAGGESSAAEQDALPKQPVTESEQLLEERNEWLYEQRQVKEKTWKAIATELDLARAKKGWEKVAEGGVRTAVCRYAASKNLPLRVGKGGHPKSKD